MLKTLERLTLWIVENWPLILLGLGAFLIYIVVGFGLAYTRAFPRGQAATEGLAHRIWDLIPRMWGTSSRIDRAYDQKLAPLVAGMDLVHGIEAVLFTILLSLFSYGWYHITALVFRDIFGEMAAIRLGPLSLAEVLAVFVILMELVVGYFLHDAFPKAFPGKPKRGERESRKTYARRLMKEYHPQRAGFMVLAILGLVLIGVEIALAWRRVEIVAAMVEQWQDISAGARKAFADQIRNSKWIFITLSVIIPVVIAILAHQFHRLQKTLVKLMGYSVGGSIAVVAVAVLAVACAILVTAGLVPYLVSWLVIPLTMFVLMLIPVGICAVFLKRARELIESQNGGQPPPAAITAAIFTLSLLGSGCSGEAPKTPSPQPRVSTAVVAPVELEGQACVVDMSRSNKFRGSALQDCVAWLQSGSTPAFLLLISSQTDTSETPQLMLLREPAPLRCVKPAPSKIEPRSAVDTVRLREAAERAERTHQQCLQSYAEAIAGYRKSRVHVLTEFAARYAAEGTGKTDIIGAFRRIQEWRDAKHLTRVELRLYSDMEDTATGAVWPSRIASAQCTDLPGLTLANVSVTVQETVADRRWKRAEMIRQSWQRLLTECWRTPEVQFFTYVPTTK